MKEENTLPMWIAVSQGSEIPLAGGKIGVVVGYAIEVSESGFYQKVIFARIKGEDVSRLYRIDGVVWDE